MCARTSLMQKTYPLGVKNVPFLLDCLGKDCHPLQFLRELTQNSIEAIARANPENPAGEVVWDVDWNWYQLQGVYKLCLIDTGVGMTGAEMSEFINKLSSSISEQSYGGNFGVGAKIATAPRNPHGIIFNSWKEGRGYSIRFWRDPITREYGLQQIERGDGSYEYWVEIEDDVKPPQIRDHGTMVVLLGKSDDENTVQAPAGSLAPSRWIANYLNTRYFRFPSGITIKAREGWEYPLEDAKRNKHRTVTGQEKYLAEHAEASGSVGLAGATAHWWILRDEPALTQESNYYASAGHVATLYKNELYELVRGRAATAQLQQFGVIFGSRRVVIYVEPKDGVLGQLAPNTSRTQLLIDGEPLPWAEWAAEFREEMPEEIQRHVRENSGGTSNTDHAKSIRDRLRPLLSLFKVTRYRPIPSGSVLVDDETRVRGGVAKRGASTDSGATGGGGGRGGSKGGGTGNLYALFEKKRGVPGDRVNPDPFPQVKWISLSDQSRDPGDLEDRAARFLRSQNLLLINKDFRVFRDMVAVWRKEVDAADETVPLIESVVHGWFEQALIETVIGIQGLHGSSEWGEPVVEKALSEEALTTAVMQRYHINVAVKRELGSKLGKLSAA